MVRQIEVVPGGCKQDGAGSERLMAGRLVGEAQPPTALDQKPSAVEIKLPEAVVAGQPIEGFVSKNVPGGQLLLQPAEEGISKRRGAFSIYQLTADRRIYIHAAPLEPGHYRVLLYPFSPQLVDPIAMASINITPALDQGATTASASQKTEFLEPPQRGDFRIHTSPLATAGAVHMIRVTSPAGKLTGLSIDLVNRQSGEREQRVGQTQVRGEDALVIQLLLPVVEGEFNVRLRSDHSLHILGSAGLTIQMPSEEAVSLAVPSDVQGCRRFTVHHSHSAAKQAASIRVANLTGQATELDFARLNPGEQRGRTLLFAPALPGTYEVQLMTALGEVLNTVPLRVSVPGVPEDCEGATEYVTEKRMGLIRAEDD
ncbi:MAG: hypothetical protein K9L88_01745 [Chromatiaceae bacterium]|nr:hypothetical protein [Chromatiaceae bacterium]MCF8014471.1 hypothetical protein [Chromatiaceae bacterium]